LKKDNKSKEWIDFGLKIVYIHEKLFLKDTNKLIHYFTDQSISATRKRNRKKTIENWLEGKTKKPNGFHLSKFKINEYKLNGELLLPINAFKSWSIDMFKKRIDIYIKEKTSLDIPNVMRYIYFFDTSEDRLGYFEINYPHPENQQIIHLNSPLYSSNMIYKGHITNYNNMTYITVKNNFDYMHYLFKNNVHVFRKELNVFGVAQCVDALTREPKSFMALLTSKKLRADEERKFAHKLNFSNLIIADDFSHLCVLEEDYFLENFSQKIDLLDRDITHYNIHEKFSKDMYFDIVLKEYRSYIKLLKKSQSHNDYYIDHKRHSILFALKDMCIDTKADATIAYLLDSDTLNILDTKNPILEMQLELVRADRLSLFYIFMIQDPSLLCDRVIEQIEYIQSNGIKVKLIDNSSSIYSKILLVKDKDFAIYKRRNELDDENLVTRNRRTINALSSEIGQLEKSAISLKDYIKKKYTLNGKWYSYSYNSRTTNQSCYPVEFNIQNNSVTANFAVGKREGTIHRTELYTLLLFNNSVIKIHNISIKENIFRISIIGKEDNMYHRDVMLFGIMSREELSKDDVCMLLDNLHRKQDEKFRLKISNDFDETLAHFNIKRG
jgi:hypothetical protein